MSSNALSAQQGGFQSPQPYRYTGVSSPAGLGAKNSSSAAARTAWKNESNPYGTPTPLSKETSGSFYNWDAGSGSTAFKE